MSNRHVYVDPTEIEFVDATSARSIIGFRSGRTIEVDFDFAMEVIEKLEMIDSMPLPPEGWNPEEN